MAFFPCFLNSLFGLRRFLFLHSVSYGLCGRFSCLTLAVCMCLVVVVPSLPFSLVFGTCCVTFYFYIVVAFAKICCVAAVV